MGRRKQFICKKNASTFRLVYRPGTDGDEPQQILLPISGKPQPGLVEEYIEAEEENIGFKIPFFGGQLEDLAEEKRREIVELGLPDDGYDYLRHLRVIKQTKLGVWPAEQQIEMEPSSSVVFKDDNQGQSSGEEAKDIVFVPPQPDVKFIDARDVGVKPTSEDPDNLEVSKSICKNTQMLEEIGRNHAREIRELEALMEEMEKSDEEPQNYESIQTQNTKANQNIKPKGDLLDDFVISATANDSDSYSDPPMQQDHQISNFDLNYDVNQNGVDDGDLISSRSAYSAITSINIGSEAVSGSQYMQEVQFEKFQKLMDEYERDGDFEGLEDIIEGDEFDEFESNEDEEANENVQQLELAMNELIINRKGELKQTFDSKENDTYHTKLQMVNQDDEIKKKIRHYLGQSGNKKEKSVAVEEDCEIQNFDDEGDDTNFVNDDLFKKNVQSVWVETKLPADLRWDCESMASMRSSTRNQAGLLSAPKKPQKNQQVPSVSKIQVNQEDIKSVVSNVSTVRTPNETPEEKRARKSAVKEMRRESRAAKKEMKKMFSSEKVTQQRHQASMGVQPKVVL